MILLLLILAVVQRDHHTCSSVTSSGSEFIDSFPHHVPCLVENMLAALRESLGTNGELTNHSLTLFGICISSDLSSGSVLLELLPDANRNQRKRLENVHPVGVHSSEEDKRGGIILIFDLPKYPVSNPVLLLAFETPFTRTNLCVTLSGRTLQPNTQTMCISGETRYILLTGKSSEDYTAKRWKISVDTKFPEQILKEILTGGKSGSDVHITPLLLSAGRRGSDPRYMGSFPASSQTSSFLCELKRFLGDIMPQVHPEHSPFQLASLPSLPPVTLGLTSSETLLSGLINSSTLTVFAFSPCSTTQGLHGKFALSAALSEELRKKLEQRIMQITEILKEEELHHRATDRLRRLIEYTVFPLGELGTGEQHYRGFLLLKALQTMSHTYQVKKGRRTKRGIHNKPKRGYRCRLRSLIMPLQWHVIGPDNANIYNCHGSCAFPLVNPTTHAVLLNSHIENERAVKGNVAERAPCCVPVAYEDLHMVILNAQGTSTELRSFTNVVAKECGCR